MGHRILTTGASEVEWIVGCGGDGFVPSSACTEPWCGFLHSDSTRPPTRVGTVSFVGVWIREGEVGKTHLFRVSLRGTEALVVNYTVPTRGLPGPPDPSVLVRPETNSLDPKTNNLTFNIIVTLFSVPRPQQSFSKTPTPPSVGPNRRRRHLVLQQHK